MNILLIANKFPYPTKDGGSIATMNLALGLQKAGNKVSLLAINTSKHFFNINNLPDELKEIITFHTVSLDTSIKPFRAIQNFLFSKIPYNAERFINDVFANYLKDLLQKENFDTVQCEGLYMLPYVEVIKKYSKALISYRAHNIEYEIWERIVINENSIPKKLYLKSLSKRIKRFEKHYVNQYDILIPITERDGNQLSNLGNKKPTIVTPTGLDISNYEYNTDSEYPSLFFIGALDWIPNQEGLIWFLENVWQKISSQSQGVNFYIAGRNAAPEFESQIKKHKIIYLGEIDDAKKYISKYSIMIVPLLSGSGMRIKIIEGLALAKAIISTSIGCEGIPVSHNENLLIANTANDFLEHSLNLLSNKHLFNTICTNARIFAEKNYDNFAISKTLSDFYWSELNRLKN